MRLPFLAHITQPYHHLGNKINETQRGTGVEARGTIREESEALPGAQGGEARSRVSWAEELGHRCSTELGRILAPPLAASVPSSQLLPFLSLSFLICKMRELTPTCSVLYKDTSSTEGSH